MSRTLGIGLGEQGVWGRVRDSLKGSRLFMKWHARLAYCTTVRLGYGGLGI